MTGMKTLQMEREIRVQPITATEQERRVHHAIALRAYELFEARGGSSWHELDDWRRAESEVRCTMCFGLTESGDKVLIGCDLNRFQEGSIEIWIAPRRITISGKPVERSAYGCAQGYGGPVFREIQLPAEIDPKAVAVERKHRLLEIKLPLAHPEMEHLKRANVA